MPADAQPSANAKRPKLKISGEKTKVTFDQKMKDLKRKDMERLTSNHASQAGYPYIDLEGFPISPEALMLVPRELAQESATICFLNLGSELRLGTTDPTSPKVQAVVAHITTENPAYHTKVYMISQRSLDKAMSLYEMVPETRPVVRGVKISPEELEQFSGEFTDFADIANKMRQVSITELVTFIIASSISARASDIHIEAEEKDVHVRYRIDGVLQDVAALPRELWKRLNSRIKLLAGLKINVNTIPQDGRFSIDLASERIDVRVSALPTNFGESIVMRLLLSSAASLAFKDLGLYGKTFTLLEREIKRPNGMIITTGPTGSGKTTTLYAIINELNTEDIKIITIEDPIEYQLKGINQSQVDYEKGYSFASGLKSILRQDPDVILVGEIRDFDTAEISIQASLTGHLVVSTLHTNSAAGAIPRLLSMGTKPFLLAPALNSVIGQRLVRRLCQTCKKPYAPTSEELARATESLDKLLASPQALANAEREINLEKLNFYTAEGCEDCHKLGYKGRIGIYEIFSMSPDIEKVILSGTVSEYEMQDIAIRQGMITMFQDGILKALDGVTSLSEVFNVSE